MKRKLVTILIGCMTLGLFGCGSGLSDTTKRLTPQQSEDSEQNADHTGNEDQQAEADTTEKKAEDDSTETTFGYRYRQFALNLLDEPVAGMTDHETERTAELFLELKGKHTLVVVEHDMDFIGAISNKVTVLAEGSVLAEGTLAEVSANEKVIEGYLGR